MKIRRLIRISLIAIFIACVLLYNLHCNRYTKQFEVMTQDILINAHSWQELLVEAVAEKAISEGHTRELLSENSSFVHEIEYEPEYSGIYLVTKWMFPSEEGILISNIDIAPIPHSRNTGTEIEFLGSANELFLYRLHYYWD